MEVLSLGSELLQQVNRIRFVSMATIGNRDAVQFMFCVLA